MTTTEKCSSDSLVCYCFKQTARALVEGYARYGSLEALQKETKAGMGCGGCRILLHAMFGEIPEEVADPHAGLAPGTTACVKPGSRQMKGLVIADDRLESKIYSCNAVPPQLADCNATMPVQYMLLDQEGRPVLVREQILRTNETFIFDTRRENLPRPFYGTFVYQLGRSNYGAARFNVYWSSEKSTTSTHEISDSGRPDVALPIVVDSEFLKGPNTIYLAVMNTRNFPIDYRFRVFDVETLNEKTTSITIMPNGTRWFNVNTDFYRPVLDVAPTRQVALRISAPGSDTRFSQTMYFFVHNKITDLWNCNHL